MLLHVILYAGFFISGSSSLQNSTKECHAETFKNSEEPKIVSTTCRYLENVNFSYSSLLQFPKFQERMLLKKINLSHNRIVSVPRGRLENIPKVEIIDFSHNRLLVVHEYAGFRELLYLQEIYLQNNRLGVFNLNMFEGLSAVTLIHLQNNRDLCLQCTLQDWVCNLKGILTVANCNNPSKCINHLFIENIQCSDYEIEAPFCKTATTTHPSTKATTGSVAHSPAVGDAATVTYNFSDAKTATVIHPSGGKNTSAVTHSPTDASTAFVARPASGADAVTVNYNSSDAKTATAIDPSGGTKLSTRIHPSEDVHKASATHITADANAATVTHPSSDGNTGPVAVNPGTVTVRNTSAGSNTTIVTHSSTKSDSVTSNGNIVNAHRSADEPLNASHSHEGLFWMNNEYYKLTVGCVVSGIILNLLTVVLYFLMYWKIQISFSVQKHD